MLKKREKLDIENINEVISLSKKLLKIGLIIAIIVLIALATYLIKTWKILEFIKTILIIISPVFIGLLIAWLFDPVANALEKKMPRVLSCILIFIIFFGGIILLLSMLLPTFTEQIKEFITGIPSILKDLKDLINGLFLNVSGDSGIDLTSVKEQIFTSIESLGISLTTKLPDMIISIATSVVSGGMIVILGIMIGFYMLYDFGKVKLALLDFVPKKYHSDAKELMKRLNHSLRGYIQGLFAVMFLVFITQSIGLTLAGLKAPMIFALFCAITDIIPYLGPYIGGAPAVLVGFTISPVVGIFTLISIVVVQLLENNFYQPLIMGKAMQLHPVTIIVGLLLFEHFFGIIGMIVATPVIACFKVILTYIDEKMNVMEMIREN